MSRQPLLPNADNIRLLILDVDGVLTDGKVSYSSLGEEMKSFHIQDGLGIKLLRSAGIEVGIITGRNSPMVTRRAQELGITFLIQGREDKLTALEEALEPLSLSLREVAFMGDDLPDFLALDACGLAFTVANAHPEILAIADWISTRNGGDGAVREACDALLKAKGIYAQTIASLVGKTTS